MARLQRTILVLAANPTEDISRLRLDKELRDIMEGLRRSSYRDAFRLVQHLAVRPEDIRRALLEEMPSIVHFVGHGSSPGLMLEDSNGNPTLVAPYALANLFKLFSDSIECVVLNASYSQSQAEAIAEYIPYVIGIADEISDSAAMSFSTGFYDALAAGRAFTDAFEFGRNALHLEGASQYSVPVLLSSEKKPIDKQADSTAADKKEILKTFFSELTAKLENRETDNVFSISQIEGKLSSFLPITVSLAEEVTEESVSELLSYANGQNIQQGEHITIMVYEKKPDTIFYMKITELRLKKELIIIPIPFAAIEKALINKSAYALLTEYTEQYLPGADLFDSKNAIGDTLAFFGRQTLLYTLQESLKNGQSSGLFGMRKSGKTSILLQLSYSLQDYPVIHTDLQLYGGRNTYAAKIGNEIITKLYKLATISKFTTDTMPRLDTLLLPDSHGAEITNLLVDRINELADILRQKTFKLPIICFLDEVERIFPFESDSKEKVEEFNAFFGALRVLSQESRILGLLVADVHPDCTRRNHWTQADVPTNPVYNFFQEIFVPPFEPEDTYSMLSDIGGLMARAFDNETQDTIHHQCGGQPFIARQLASMLCKKIPAAQGRISYPVAQPYLMKPFIHSSVLKSYFEQNIWADLDKRKNILAMKILKLLACNEELEKCIYLDDLVQKLEDYSESECLDVLHWMENVSFIDMTETDGDYYYSSKIPLLSQWVRMQMKPSEIKAWRITI